MRRAAVSELGGGAGHCSATRPAQRGHQPDLAHRAPPMWPYRRAASPPHCRGVLVAEALEQYLNRLLYTATSDGMGTGERQAVGAEWGLRTLGLCQS